MLFTVTHKYFKVINNIVDNYVDKSCACPDKKSIYKTVPYC